MAAHDPDHSGKVYPINIVSIPAQHDNYVHVLQRPGCGAAFAWPRLRCLNM